MSSDTPVSTTNKTDRHDITEILFKVPLNTIVITLTMEQEFRALPEHLSSPPGFSGVSVAQCLVFFAMFCRSLFVLCILAIVLTVLSPLTASDCHFVLTVLSPLTPSDCHFGILQLFLHKWYCIL